MRRWVTVFLLVLLPLQFSWAAAARYCSHEKVASHFGHHEHEHKAASGHAGAVTPQAADQADTKLLPGDDDCDYCQLGASQPLLTDVADSAGNASAHAPPEPGVHHIGTREPDSLERPNWRIA